MNDAIVLQSPPQADSLVLLFHGVGSTPQDLAPLGAPIARALPQAAVVSIAAPDRSDFGSGRQWFSVQGVTEDNRPARVQATLPRFAETVRHWQQQTGVGPDRTTLVGFSQGAIMSLASTTLPQPPAQRIVSLSGRFDALPDRVAPGVRFHFVHGEQDAVIPVAHAVAAAERLRALGAEVSFDRIPGLGHGIDARALAALLKSVAPA